MSSLFIPALIRLLKSQNWDYCNLLYTGQSLIIICELDINNSLEH